MPIQGGGGGGGGSPSGGGGLTLLSHTVLASTAATLSASSLSTSYASLLIVGFFLSDGAAPADTWQLTFNGDTGTNYDWGSGAGGSSTTSSHAHSANHIDGGCSVTANASAASTLEMRIAQYAGTTLNKTAVWQGYQYDGAGSNIALFGAGFWHPAAAAAIASLSFDLSSGGNFVAGSSLYVYGLAAS